ncbi:proto-oncogene Mas-like [Bombina bombina]|uniref:proto-oncogene Mas-like n=1 Tax=Bombina bombina TaxID=8345 RepID=UPI00235A8293|nr:proto-oncogene Mas-like [Bombina bombina]
MNNNTTQGANGTVKMSFAHYSIVASFAMILSLFGLIGNGIVFWILVFKMKRNKYTVYILNLAIADFLYLFFVAITMILMVDQILNRRSPSKELLTSLEIMYDFGYISGMLFLTAISVERCLSVLFPIWHKCYRPKHLSTFVCGLLWAIGAFLSLADNLGCPPEFFSTGTSECTALQIFSTVLTFGILIPLMLLSSFILVYVIKTTSQTCRPPKIYVAIILTVCVFLISVAPIRLMWIFLYFKMLPNNFQTLAFFFSSTYCTVFNSSANPFIYFFVGRQKKKRFGGSINEAFSRVFKDDDTEQTTDYDRNTSVTSIK